MIDEVLEDRPQQQHLINDAADSNWRNVLWREWRHAEDADYARYLWELVGGQPLSRRHKVAVRLLGLLWGALLGLLVDITLSPFTLPLFIWLGGLVGARGGFLLGERLSMRRWLALLTPQRLDGRGIVLIGLLPPAVIGLTYAYGLGILVTGAALGVIAGWRLGLILGVIASPLLWLLSLVAFQGDALTVTDLAVTGAAVGTGLGFGTLLRARGKPVDAFASRNLCFWWHSAPAIAEVTAALHQAVQTRASANLVWKNLLWRLDTGVVAQDSPEVYIASLGHPSWQERLIARANLIALGAETIEPLVELARQPGHPLRRTAFQLLRRIERETKRRLTKQRPLCPDCLRRWRRYTSLITTETPITYYGCRTCGRSKDAAYGEVVSVLDVSLTVAWAQQAGQIRVNWFHDREVFDFDRVEIVQAEDEDVERFAVQVGNDTDEFRAGRYAEIPCTLAPTCEVSENTLRILQRTFGEVRRE